MCIFTSLQVLERFERGMAEMKENRKGKIVQGRQDEKDSGKGVKDSGVKKAVKSAENRENSHKSRSGTFHNKKKEANVNKPEKNRTGQKNSQVKTVRNGKSKCPVSHLCGGCEFIDVPYAKQLMDKQ